MPWKVKTIMETIFQIDKNFIDDNTNQHDIEKWDSLRHIDLVAALEEEFETEIPDEEAEKITTVQQAIDYINQKT